MQELIVTSPCFAEGDWIPLENSARGKDLSPELHLSGKDEKAVCFAVTMDDSSHPLFPNYNHWVIWNIPVMETIPGSIPKGAVVSALNGAIQGLAYGRNCYKGPKPPLKAIHTYTFTVFVLDCFIKLPEHSRRKDLFQEIEGHVLQKATLSGKFQSRRK